MTTKGATPGVIREFVAMLAGVIMLTITGWVERRFYRWRPSSF